MTDFVFCYAYAIYIYFFWPFLALLIVQLEECDRKQGKRVGVTHSKGTRAGSWTPVRRRVHGSRATNQAKRRPSNFLIQREKKVFILWKDTRTHEGRGSGLRSKSLAAGKSIQFGSQASSCQHWKKSSWNENAILTIFNHIYLRAVHLSNNMCPPKNIFIWLLINRWLSLLL